MKYSKEYLKNISFPLGGIGTGCIGLAGNGALRDWEIFNRPAKNTVNGCSHFAVRVKTAQGCEARILNGDIQGDATGYGSGFGYGYNSATMCGFPHFRGCEFEGRFPLAELKFSDPTFPLEIRLTAFNPFIPRDALASGLPAAFFELETVNTMDCEAQFTAALSVENPFIKSENRPAARPGAVFMKNASAERDSVDYADLTVAAQGGEVSVQPCWYRGSWQDAKVMYWNELSSGKPLSAREYPDAGSRDTATVSATFDLRAGQRATARFVICWNAPNCNAYWRDEPEQREKTWKNYYATVFENSAKTADYCLDNFDSLLGRTRRFTDILHSTTLPPEVIDAAASNLSVLKSPTVLRLEDGSFYGWEGVHCDTGSCEGTCSHVWNYAYAMCFLFPELERSIRELELDYSTDADGDMDFRMLLPPGFRGRRYDNCADGQFGSVIKCWREWRISGDNEWLKKHIDKIEKQMEYAWSPANPRRWDYDRDGLLEGRQHHTLDMELFGPSGWLQGMYMAALKAAQLMEKALGREEKSAEFSEMFKKAAAGTETLFNGEYYAQKVDLSDKSVCDRFDCADKYWNAESGQLKYQIGEGCEIDQLLGRWHADICGLEGVFDDKNVKTALDSLYKYNFKPRMRDFANPWRIFAVNDEAGAVICDYPEGRQKPAIPIPYCEESMHGFEYALAGLFAAEGQTQRALKLVGAVRERYNGANRNPYNEIECGNNYARSMASFALIPIFAGFTFDMPGGRIGFNPKMGVKDGFSCLWSLDCGYGEFTADENGATVTLAEGELPINTIVLPFLNKVGSVEADGRPLEFTFVGGELKFAYTRITRQITVR